MLRCLNCHSPVTLDDSLTEKFPEWQTLTASGISRGSAASKKSRDELEEAPTDPSSLGGTIGHFTAQQGNLFDLICSDSSPLELPMCHECTDQFLDAMDQQLAGLDKECADYDSLLGTLKNTGRAGDSRFDLNSSRIELAKLQSEENALRSELARLETEEREIDKQLSEEQNKFETSRKEEERLWRVYRDLTRKLLELESDEESVRNQLNYATEQLDKLSKTNIFNLTFHIWHSGHFGTINGFKLGRLPDEQVEWTEINAALGQTVLLLQGLARRLSLRFVRFEPVPFGNNSYMRVLMENSKDKELPLYDSGGYKFWGSPKFDSAMVALLECLKQLQLEIETKSGGFMLPYKMDKDKIVESNKEYSVKIQFNSEERWTKAMKCLLTNMKWALAWVASLES